MPGHDHYSVPHCTSRLDKHSKKKKKKFVPRTCFFRPVERWSRARCLLRISGSTRAIIWKSIYSERKRTTRGCSSASRGMILARLRCVTFSAWASLKGQFHDIQWFFCAFFFTRAKYGGCSRKCRGHQTWMLGWSRGLHGILATNAGYQCWQRSEPTSRARLALVHLSTAAGSTFVFRLCIWGRSQVISPSSRFNISSDSYIDIDSLFSCFVLRAFRSLFRQSRRPAIAWVIGRRYRQCRRSCLCSDPDDVDCEGKCAERGTSSRKGCRPADRLYCGVRTVCDKDLKTQETHLW